MDGTRERRVVQCARRLLFDPEHAFRDRGAAFARRSREIRDSKNQKNCALELSLRGGRWEGAVTILFLATHTFSLPLAAHDPQQLDGALGVRWKNIVDLCCIIKSHFS